jgi:ketosteroid isomerase-like protein
MRILSALLLIFLAALVGPAQSRSKELKTLVDTERAFSRMSEEKGIRESFTEFIAEDGILFRPTPVKGKQWMREHPLPPSTTRPLLTWQPMFAGISRAGDMGYTTGPWQYKNDIKDAKPSAFGNFMTVWKKQANGEWKFAVDLGVSHPEPKTPSSLTFGPGTVGRFKKIDLAAARAALLNQERQFSKASAERGAVEAFLSKADVQVRLFRNNQTPFVGRKAAASALTPLSLEWTWTPTFADVSTSGDLGYSYGIYQLRHKKSQAISETGNYLRVWKKVTGRWRVVIDVADPLPAEKKN